MAIDEMNFEEDMSPSAPQASAAGAASTKSPEEMEALNSALAAFEPQDILQYLIEQGKLPPETQLVEPEETEEAEPGMEEPPMEAMAETGGGLGGLSFEGM